MDGKRFDAFSRQLAAGRSRRALLRSFLFGVASATAFGKGRVERVLADDEPATAQGPNRNRRFRRGPIAQRIRRNQRSPRQLRRQTVWRMQLRKTATLRLKTFPLNPLKRQMTMAPFLAPLTTPTDTIPCEVCAEQDTPLHCCADFSCAECCIRSALLCSGQGFCRRSLRGAIFLR